MKFYYKKYFLYGRLLMAAIWILIGLVRLYNNDVSNFLSYAILLFGLGHGIVFIHYYKNQYIRIIDGYLKFSEPFKKDIKIDDIITIKKQYSEIYIGTKDKKQIIKTDIIEANSLNQLIEELNKISRKRNISTSL